jgi:hypothetical protein
MSKTLASRELRTLVCKVISASEGPNAQQKTDEALAQVLAPYGFIETACAASGGVIHDGVLYVKQVTYFDTT